MELPDYQARQSLPELSLANTSHTRSDSLLVLHRYEFPLLGALDQGLAVLWPVVKGLGIEVSSVGPDESVNFWVYANLIKKRQILQGAIEVSTENLLEIDRLSRIVIERDAYSVGREKFE